MKKINYLNSVSNNIYHDDTYSLITKMTPEIQRVAKDTGVSAGAIAGAIAEENSYLTFFKDDLIDFKVTVKMVPQTDKQGNVIYDHLGQPVMIVAKRTHADWVDDYNKAESFGLDTPPTKSNKWDMHSLVDVGPGNFRIARAIKIVKDNADKYPELQQYQDHYDKLVDDLISEDSSLTALMYGIYLKEAEEFFTTKSPYQNHWDELPTAFQDALLISFVNAGQTRLTNIYKARKEPLFLQ